MATAQLVNPFREGMHEDRATSPVQLVIFGAGGDLTKRKLLPAIYNLAEAQLLPPGFCVTGFARNSMSDDDFRKSLKTAVATSSDVRDRKADVLDDLADRTHYVTGDFKDKAAYQTLKARLAEFDTRYGTAGNRIFYIATPASLFGGIVQNLHDAGMTQTQDAAQQFVRIIVEKPFGRDLASAKALNAEMLSCLHEEQIYRIDHYLGKETVQNILVFRFANGIFEPVWNRRYVDHVQITVAESIGIEGRASFYEETGVVRDVIQNHALQLLSLVAMEPCTSFDARDFRDEKIRVVSAMRPIEPAGVKEAAVRGQYGSGFVDGADAAGYRQEDGVAPDSVTPTYAAFRFWVENWRWAGVPFYVRSGKRLAKRATEILIQFKPAPHPPFHTADIGKLESNSLSLRIQPDEGITLKIGAKVPGPSMRIRTVDMDFGYGATFGAADSSPYERLIL
ncbi:MAG TPA: glucose-6-phosphate dehydrogenase, partial [Candidatus Eremiobacteraceae bacterium]|nr:glucose-6-phosphate dehydrogenase [Candidatus Eremiobacteraceae bacterium]